MRRVRVPVLAGYRRDVDDASICAGEHVRNHGAAGEKGANQVHLDDPAPHLGIELPRQPVPAGDPRVVDEDVDAAMLPDRRVGRGANRPGGRNLHALGRHGAERRQLAPRGFRRVAIDIPQRHGRSGLERAPRGGVADAPRPTGDDGDAVCQVELIHQWEV